jgi:hypothetical protein
MEKREKKAVLKRLNLVASNVSRIVSILRPPVSVLKLLRRQLKTRCTIQPINRRFLAVSA